MKLLSVKGINKSYRTYRTEFHRIVSWFLPFISPRSETRVLSDISFDVFAGDSIGLIGVNGAGKSTLLKILTGTTYPTSGEVQRFGKISAILELGLGFNPNLSGRQNAINTAGLMGYSQEEILNVLPDVEIFADIGEYFERPVRLYSSGMQVRVAFSIATAFRPDILIVDEALSVGDIQFQQKCISRIREFRDKGTALLFVTHDLNSLHTICDKGILLSEGQIRFFGETTKAAELYFGYLNRNKGLYEPKNSSSVDIESSFEKTQKFLRSITIVSKGVQKSYLIENEDVSFIMSFKGLSQFSDPHVGFRIQDHYGTVMYETNTFCHKMKFLALEEQILEVKFKNILAPGSYTIAIGIEAGANEQAQFDKVISLTERVLNFDVMPDLDANKWAGKVNLNPVFINYEK